LEKVRVGYEKYDRHGMFGHFCPECIAPPLMEGGAEIIGGEVFLRLAAKRRKEQ
jgi:hypothetical protein